MKINNYEAHYRFAARKKLRLSVNVQNLVEEKQKIDSLNP